MEKVQQKEIFQKCAAATMRVLDLLMRDGSGPFVCSHPVLSHLQFMPSSLGNVFYRAPPCSGDRAHSVTFGYRVPSFTEHTWYRVQFVNSIFSTKTAVNAPGFGGRPKGGSHGMLVLTRPVKQPTKIGSGSTTNLKKETSESMKPIATNITISGRSNISKKESVNVGLVKDNPKPTSAVDKSDVYVTPSLQGLHSTSVPSASGKLEPVPVEKTAVLSGEEFPSLQASLTTTNTNVQQQQSKDNQLDSKEQLEKLQYLSLQAQSKSYLDDVFQPDFNRFEPQRPQFFRPSLLRGNEQITLEKPKTVNGKPDGYLSRNPSLLGNDESANSFENRLSSADGVKTLVSGIYRREGLSKESPNHGSSCSPELAQPNCGVIHGQIRLW